MTVAHWIAIGIAVAVSMTLVFVVHWLLNHKLGKLWPMARYVVSRSAVTAYTAAAVVGANLALPSVQEVGRSTFGTISHAMDILMICTLTALGISLAYAATDMVLQRLSLNNADADRRARRLQTQVRLLRRVITSVIVVLAIAAVLFTFDAVKALGAGLLASAGVIGIVAGVAAQSTLGNLFAGLQLAFSDALRIGDVVVVEGEWGRVEELSLVNVTIKIWDERRLVVPVANFTTTSFENWTKSGTNITAKVQFPLDWQVPIAELREEAGTLITSSRHWDGRSWSCQVVDVSDTGEVMVRVVATAADTGDQWNIACEIREHLISWLVTHYPNSLPRRRTEFVTGGEPDESLYAAEFPTSAFRRATAASGATRETNGSARSGDPEEV
ncbi:mechanosensitive ion channel family protein [Nocardiopsis sp. MG754419]|uniref:mechanosensitive ion channel family protein n=1 Tax=Nocardiopsis sp. MG754419 TaxID=2259865 RepID=UPI001BADE5C0|nr:mechanosensitive ion channel domain-containing protein [Nocardiopsis sp. MG754419]MBR8742764.1 mechanosensitive ion channel protein MscS [Nocardiopsis sp. MG754419]